MNSRIFHNKNSGSELKEQIYNWLKIVHPVFVLDSNHCPDRYGQYDLLAGIGTRKKMVLPELNPRNANDFFNALTQGYFTFLTLAYDTKNLFHQLQSENPKLYSWPDALMYQPDTLIRLKRDGTLRIDSHSQNPQMIFEAIQSAEDFRFSSPQLEWTRIPGFVPYQKKFEDIMHHLYDGDIYEVNYCHCFSGDLVQEGNHLNWFQELNALAPKPFSAFVSLEHADLLCFSPERFLRKSGSSILTQPIKGTFPVEQTEYGEKEIAENLMIVDLCRNDLAQISATGSIEVPELLGTYAYQNIKHLISTVRGSLREETTIQDIFSATFPMGSMTGAPKHSAMQIIEKTEEFRRGIYSGTVGYVDENGDFDLNVVIRSAILDKEKAKIHLPVGGALLYDSNDRAEYEETLAKIDFFTKETAFKHPSKDQ